MRSLLRLFRGAADEPPLKGWKCNACEELHFDLPAWALLGPETYLRADEDSRAEDFVIGSDTCVFRDEAVHLRCTLVIPVVDADQSFSFGVWVTVAREDFERYTTVPEEVRGTLAPIPARLANEIRGYPGTAGLAGELVSQGVGLRPQLRLAPCDHLMATQQRDGVTYAYAARFTQARFRG